MHSTGKYMWAISQMYVHISWMYVHSAVCWAESLSRRWWWRCH